MGVKNTKIQVPEIHFKDQKKAIHYNRPIFKRNKTLPNASENIFMTTLGIKANDHILAINGTNYNLDNIYDLIMSSENWKEGDENIC